MLVSAQSMLIGSLLHTAPKPVAVLPILVLPTELKLPICVKTEPSLPTVVLPIRL